MKYTGSLLQKFISWVACSFERCTNGSSARKFTMFGYFLLVAFLHTIVGKMFLTGKIVETQSVIWVLLGFLIIDTLAILMLAQILTGHDLAELANSVANKEDDKDKKSNETESIEPTTTV